MNINGNLQNGIGIQMGQIKTIEIKEATEKGRNGKTETTEKKRNVNHGFMGILCRDSDRMTNPPRTKLPRGKDPDGHEVEKVRLGDNRHMVTCERQLAVGELQRGSGGRKARTRARKAEAAESAVHMGYSRVRYRFQKRTVSTRQLLLKNTGVPRCHPADTSKTLACHVVTRRLLLKPRRATSSLGYYPQSGRRSPF
jgi:hypothetical protein